MLHWAFGLTLLLLLSTCVTPSNADEEDKKQDDDNNDEDENCRKLKERRCPVDKGKAHSCSETRFFSCTPTCRSYARSTTITKSKNYLVTTVYLCPTSVKFSTPSISMSRSFQIGLRQISKTVGGEQLLTRASITPSFSMSSITDENDKKQSGDTDEGSQSVPDIFPSISPSNSKITSLPLSLTIPRPSTSSDRSLGENVFSSVAPSFTPQFVPKYTDTPPSMVFGESGISSTSSSSYLLSSVSSSGDGSGEYKGDVDECEDEDKDDQDEDDDDDDVDYDEQDDEEDDEEEDDGDSGDDREGDSEGDDGDDGKSSEKPTGTYAGSQHDGIPEPTKQPLLKKRNSCLTRSVMSVAMTTISSYSRGTSSYILPSTTSSFLPIINTLTVTPELNGTKNTFSSRSISTSGTLQSTLAVTNGTMKTKLFPSTTNSLLPIVTTLTVTPELNGRSNTFSSRSISTSRTLQSTLAVTNGTMKTKLFPSTTNSLLPIVTTLTVTPELNGTSNTFSTRSNLTSRTFQSTPAVTNGTRITTKLFPSISVSTSNSDSLTPLATPRLSLSLSSTFSASSRRIESTHSTSYYEINSTIFSTSPYSNVTVNQSTPITPTTSSTVSVSSSVQTVSVHCGKNQTGDKFNKGVLSWKSTAVGSRANTSCPYNNDKSALAHRLCQIDTANKTQWGEVKNENCAVLEKDKPVDELLKEPINEESEQRIAVLTEYLTKKPNPTVDLVRGGADLLEKLVNNATDLSKITKELLTAVSNVMMNADPKVLTEANKEHKSTTKILKTIEKLLDEINLSGQKIRQDSSNLVAEAWDIVNKTTNLNFSDDNSLVSVSLPASLLQRYKKKQRITFINFSNDKLFAQTPDERKTFINSKIVSASVKGEKVKNLTDPVVIEFKITNKSYALNSSCVFWDFEADGGLGRWSRNGCNYKVIDDGRVRCHCNHLTHFGILVDLFPDKEPSETDQLILQGITFVGCYLSIVGLVLTIIALLSFKQYRSGVSGQILLNLALALLISLVIFLAGIERVENENTCIAMAALLHYFVLVAVLWMGLEAFHMFINVVWDRHPRALGRTFVLKCAAVAWVVPLFIVVITVLVKTDDYRNDRYCRVKGNSFYIAFLGPMLTVLLFNVIAFSLVTKALVSTRVPRNRRKQGIVHFRRVLGIAVIFGITWLFGVLAVGELKLIFQYLFCITNAFQGFMIFILYCLTDRKVREKLVRTLCALPDPNVDRMINTNSTQRQTDTEIDLEMFRGGASSPNPVPMVPNEIRDSVVIYPPQPLPDYNLPVPGSVYDPTMLPISYGPNLRRSVYPLYPVEPDEYTPRNPPGSRPVTNVPLSGVVNSSGDNLVDSTAKQLELSGSANSILFINDGRRVEVPKYPEPSGNNNNWEEPEGEQIGPSTSEGRRRYSQGEDGLGFNKPSRQNRLNSATTCHEMNKRFIFPKSPSQRSKGVRFPISQPTCRIRKAERWSDMSGFPRLKTHPRQDDMSENDVFDGTNMSGIEHEQRQRQSEQSSGRVIDENLEKEYLSSYGEHRELEISENFIAASGSRELKTMDDSSKKEAPVDNIEDSKVRMQSSGSDTSSEFRWSEIEHGPHLKSKSQTTVSDLDNSDDLPSEGEYFTQF